MKEEKLNTAGKKKTEVERLGMGFGSNRRYVKSISCVLQAVNMRVISSKTREILEPPPRNNL